MYARQTTIQISRENHAKAIEIYQTQIIPEAEVQRGFKGAYFLCNKNASKFISLTFWDNFQSAYDNQKSGYFQKQIDKLEELFVNPPDVLGFEVCSFSEKKSKI